MDQWDAFLLKMKSRRVHILEKYNIVGFIASGTYGKVYKATRKDSTGEYAIKIFKPDENAAIRTTVVGISQSACRETSLCSELNHENIVGLEEIMADPLDKSIYMIFNYAEHDLLQILHHHSSTLRTPIVGFTVKSLLRQLLSGVHYLHSNWILHRDLKPANILVTSHGVVKIGDLGLARLYDNPLQPLGQTDKVVVTIWYRPPELLLHSKHYTPAIDMWAVGCIFAELLILRPLFKGDEIKSENKQVHPFQRNQMEKVISILGTPSPSTWPEIVHCPEYRELKQFRSSLNVLKQFIMQNSLTNITENGLDLLCRMLEYDPTKRITANEALRHPYFDEAPAHSLNSFDLPSGERVLYPRRVVTFPENDTFINRRASMPQINTTSVQSSGSINNKHTKKRKNSTIT